MKRREKGFTLIELMITVAIVGIIAAIAAPQYMLYIAKSKTTSAMVELYAMRTKVMVYRQETGNFPTDAATVGIDNSYVADYWQNPDVNNGVISIAFMDIDGDLNGETVSMTPSVSAEGIVTWVCSSTAGNKEKLPRECQS